MKQIRKQNAVLNEFDESCHPIVYANYFKRFAGYKLEKHRHDRFHLIYITHGNVNIYADKMYQCREGDIIIIPPYQSHSLSSKDGYTQLGIDFESCSDPRNQHYALANPVQKVVYHSSAPKFLPMANEIIKWVGDMSLDSANIRMTYINLFLLLIANRQTNHQTSNFGTRLSEYLDQNLSNEISIEEIAAKLSVSTSHLQRLCHKYFGMGVKKLYNKKRFARACSLLIDTRLSAKDIGTEIGFSTPANFSSFFKKHSGIAPLTYRKNNTN